MSFKGTCLGNNVIVLPTVNTQLTEGGLDITDAVDKDQKWEKGIVVSIGEDIPLNTEGVPYIKEGDIVIFDKYRATDYIEDAVKYKAMHYQDLFKKF